MMMMIWRKVLIVAGFVALAAGSGMAQQPAAAPTPAAIGYAKEILVMKNASAMYAQAVPSVVQRTKDALLQNNLNYQKDLNDVAVVIAQSQNGREKEISDIMAKIYAADFTEQELKDLVAFYKTALGKKLLTQEPISIQSSISAMSRWAQTFSDEVEKMFRAEMRKRGKDI